MNASMDHSPPIPPHAITMWLIDNAIIAALPMSKGGPPYLMKLPLSEGGLAKALNLLRERKAEVLTGLEAVQMHRILSASQPANHPPQVKLTKSQEKLHSETTQAQRDRARALLDKMGLK